MSKHISLKIFLSQFAGVRMPRKLKDVSLKNLMEYVGETVTINDVDRRYHAIIKRIEINDGIVFCIKRLRGGKTVGGIVKRRPHRLSISQDAKPKVEKPKREKNTKKQIEELLNPAPIVEFDFFESEET